MSGEREAQRAARVAVVRRELHASLQRSYGFVVLSKIRERPAFSDLPVVVMVTSSEATRDIDRAKEVGANHYIPKEAGIASFVRTFEASFRSL